MRTFLFALLFCLITATAGAAHIEVVNVDVDDQAISDVVSAAMLVDKYMSEHGHGLITEVKVYVSTEPLPNLFSNSELMSDRIGGRSKFGVIQVLANEERSGYRLQFLTAHELIHQYQASCIGGMGALKKNMWLTEGMADVLAVEILGDNEMKGRFLYNARQWAGEGLRLSEITSQPNWTSAFNTGRHPYAKADLAVYYLYKIGRASCRERV